MKTIRAPHSNLRIASAKDTPPVQISPVHMSDKPTEYSQPVSGPSGLIEDKDRLFKQMELRLENVAERLLLSSADQNNNLLASIEQIVEGIFVRSAMRMSQGNISRAAKLLGINRNTLSKKLRVLQFE